jgi:hypothetical protein
MTIEFMAGLVSCMDEKLLVASLIEELNKYKLHNDLKRVMPALMMLTIKVHMNEAGIANFMEHLESKKEFDLFKTLKNPS